MHLIGAEIEHNSFGKGIIIDDKNGNITVQFDQTNAEKKFQYPEAFEKHLSFNDTCLQSEALAILAKKKNDQQAEKIKKQEEQMKRAYERPIIVQTTKGGKKTKKLPPRKNLAFKLNYCDGGSSPTSIGFKTVCSDEIIRYNIEKVKRAWCSFEECPCRKYYDGLISREKLEDIRKDGFTCYESISLSNWIAQAGTDLKGVNSGKARRLPNAQLGSLAALTTRYPYDDEKERIIVGVFIIDSASEGDDTKEGTVSAKSKYKIEIRPDEAQNLKFWNYYRNESNPNSIRWGTGLYRFFKDEDAVRLLQDIVSAKEGRDDFELAVDILEYFKQLHAS